MNTDKLIQLLLGLIQQFASLFTGVSIGRSSVQKEQLKAENTILKQQADIEATPEVANPLQAMADFKKETDAKKD